MHTFNSKLKSKIKKQKNCLCVGLDISPENLGATDLDELKAHTYRVIDATRDFALAYKPNFAFFERWGFEGFRWLEETVDYIGPGYIKIADAKRGDIDNTARQYAKSIFEYFKFDAVTLNPYMGKDSIEPFMEFKEKGVFVLCRTSNASASSIQGSAVTENSIIKKVVMLANDLNRNSNIGLVVGATAINELRIIRNLAPDLPMLIPGIGAQGGDLKESVIVGNESSSALVNVSRDISFSGKMDSNSIYKSAENYSTLISRYLND